MRLLCPTTCHQPRPAARRWTSIEERTVPTATGPRGYEDEPGLRGSAHGVRRRAARTDRARRALPLTGLPVGLQVVAAPYDDDTAITFAELLGEEIGGYRPPDVRSRMPIRNGPRRIGEVFHSAPSRKNSIASVLANRWHATRSSPSGRTSRSSHAERRGPGFFVAAAAVER